MSAYLLDASASLAAKHGLQIVTVDEGINHQAAFIIPA
jgi:hypothetical protein